ncbi:hypothetical protein ACWD0J_40905 [Streptomyces sp. NPDC003011]
MAVLAVIIPLLMLGVMLALGRYEDLLLPGEETDGLEPSAAPSPVGPIAPVSPIAPVAPVARREKAS